MSFESRMVAFSERFLSDRTFELVVAPALADLEFDPGRKPLARIVNRVAVLRAVLGGLAGELKRSAGKLCRDRREFAMAAASCMGCMSFATPDSAGSQVVKVSE